MPSSNPSAKWVKTRCDQAPVDSFRVDASSESTQFQLSTPSSNYFKETSNSCQASSHNSEFSFENNIKERESDSWKSNIVSFQYIKPLGNSRKGLSLSSNKPSKKKSSSIAPVPKFAYCVMPHEEGNESDGTSSSYGNKSGMGKETVPQKTLKPNRAKYTSEGKKMHFQASFHDSESSNGATGVSRNNSKQTSSISSLKSKQTLKRTLSLRPIRVLMNKSSFKSKKPSVKKCSQISQVSRLNKATCSSTIKDSKFPRCVEERESARISLTMVCPYNYCSLHGHHHSSKPPLKRALPKKRYFLKTQKSMKLRTKSSLRGKYPGDIMELNETSINIGNEEDSHLYVQISPNPIFFGRSGEGNEDDNLAELSICESTSIENNDQDDEENEIHKMYATKVVREAIEKILLPEVEDHSSDDQSSSSDFASEQEEILDNNLGESRKLNISNSTATNEEDKEKKRTPNSWSNLKRLILLKRFIKALKKVRQHNQRKPCHLPLENNPEAEKILLKPWMMDRKRSSEEWMLDYALQHVVSEMAPTQKRKVELLKKAFETLAPPTDEEQIQVPVDGKQDDYASRGQQTMKVDSLSGETALPPLTESQAAECTDKNTSSAAHNGSFKQLNLVGEVTNEDSDSMDLITTMHKPKSTLTDFCKGDYPESKREKLAVCDLTSATKRTTSDDNAEATAAAAAAADPMEKLTKAGEEKSRDSELDNRSIQEFNPVNDSKPDISCYEACKREFRREKPVNMWQLIHHHMVGGLAGEAKTKNIHKENEEHVRDSNTLAATESSGSCRDYCSWDQSTGTGYDGTESQEVELRKTFTVKLVREAIEKILLPEVQDQSSDDQSVTSDVMSEEELIENRDVQGREPKISTSADSAKDCSIDCCRNMSRYDLNPGQEGTGLTNASISESENEKTASKAQSEKKKLKGWTNLKKLILLKRFIEELEKVRKFTPKKTRLLSLKPGAEAEDVSLRHQMVDGKKSTDEWMLDYALRKVIGELAPKQKRKVALLVKAFETVAPTSGTPQIQLTFPKFNDSSHESGCSDSQQHKFVSEVTKADTKVKNNCDIHSTITDEESNVPEDRDDQKAAREDPESSFQLELLNETGRNMRLDDFEDVNVHLSSVSKCTAVNGTGVPRSTYNTNSSASASEPFAMKEQNNGDPETDCKTTVASKAQLDKQKHISMWHLLCQHVVSDIVMKVENQLPDGEDEDEQVDSPKTFPQLGSVSFHKEDSRGQINGFSQRDAVKLVREAIEEILSPEVQDDLPDAKSVTEQELPETNHCNAIKSEEKGHKIIHRELAANSIPMLDEQRTASMLGNKSDKIMPQNWSKLKKLILLKRSIKALEKARQPMLPATHGLPVKLGKEEENIDLRHRSKEEKKAEEWMLDYAIQNIVTKLTPARKRRVLMLVEAFEAIVPLPEV